jgi:hypothetical protein
VTLSIGVTDFRAGEPCAAWLARADAALYEAKRLGRNRVVAAAAADTGAASGGSDEGMVRGEPTRGLA